MAAYQWLIVLSAVLQATPARPTLQGTVEDSQGRPVAGARVDIATAAPRVGEGLFCPSCYLDCKKSTRTDDQGKFSIADLDPTLKFRVLVSMAGKQANLTSLVDPVATVVTIKLADQPTDVPPERMVRGVIVNQQGAPIEGALLSPYGAHTIEKRWWGTVKGVDPTVSDHQGRFSMVLPENLLSVDLTVTADGYAGRLALALEPGDKEHQVIVPLGTRVTGRLVHKSNPLAGIRLAVVQIDRRVPRHFVNAVTATTDSDGRFAFGSLPAYDDYVIFSLVGAGPQDFVITTKRFLASGNALERNLGTLEAIPALRLAGRVELPEGQALPENATVVLSRNPAWDLIAAPVQPDGSFEILGLPPEAYEVRIGPKDQRIDTQKIPLHILDERSFALQLTDNMDQLIVPLVAKTSEERGSATERVIHSNQAKFVRSEVDTTRGIKLSGRLLKENQPRVGVEVKLLSTHDKTGRRFPVTGETTTDAEGRYAFDGLQAGDSYFLRIADPEELVAPAWIYQSPFRQTVGPMISAIELADVHLVRCEQTLSGTVVDTRGKPLAGITVSAGMGAGRSLSRPDKGPAPWTDSDSDGRFVLQQLPDDRIELMAYRPNPKGGTILFPTRVWPKLNDTDIRIVFDPTLIEGIENLDTQAGLIIRPANPRSTGD